LLLYLVIDCCIIIIFYPRQSLFSEHTRIQHVTKHYIGQKTSDYLKQVL